MKPFVSKTMIYSLAIYFLWYAAVLDPVGKLFMLRYVALVYAVACLLLSGRVLALFEPNTSLRNVTIIYISFLMPIHGLLMYAMRAGYTSDFIDTSYISAGILLLISLIYQTPTLCNVGLRAMIGSGRLLSILIILVYLISTTDAIGELGSFLYERGIALVNTREYASFSFPYIYFFASPMLIYLIAFDLSAAFDKPEMRNILKSGVSIFALALSGTRFHIVLACLFPFVFYILRYPRQKFLLLGAFVVLVMSAQTVTELPIVNEIFSPEEASNAKKLGMVSYYWEMFRDIITYLFGQGYNAHAWSSPLREIISIERNASKSELTYLEIFRVYGVLISVPFFLLLVALVRRLGLLSKDLGWLYPAFIIFLVGSASNPYLFSTNGMLPLGLILAVVSQSGRLNSSVNALTNVANRRSGHREWRRANGHGGGWN